MKNKLLKGFDSWVRRHLDDDKWHSETPNGPTEARPLTIVDQRVLSIVEDRLRVYGGDHVADVTQEWGATAGMWFVEVTPYRPEAATLSVAFDGHDLLSIVVGQTWFEVFPLDESVFRELSEVLDAVFAGQVIERGTPSQTAAVIGIGAHEIKVGAWPVADWPKRRYAPYR